jgi:recombinational DNA repair ATPase RecF
MILRLRLRNWRSYEDLDLELGPGTTFVVAPNGVGKTSLVYGLAWGVFGPHGKTSAM